MLDKQETIVDLRDPNRILLSPPPLHHTHDDTKAYLDFSIDHIRNMQIKKSHINSDFTIFPIEKLNKKTNKMPISNNKTDL